MQLDPGSPKTQQINATQLMQQLMQHKASTGAKKQLTNTEWYPVSRLQDSGEKSLSKKKFEKRARATAPFPKSRASYLWSFRRWSGYELASLRGRRLKGKGKGVQGARGAAATALASGA